MRGARTARVVSDREGGHVALDPVPAGSLIELAPISPPIRTRRDRQLRRRGLAVVLVGNAAVLLVAVALILAAAVARGGW